MIQHEKLLCGVEKVNVQYRPCTEKGLSSEFFLYIYNGYDAVTEMLRREM